MALKKLRIQGDLNNNLSNDNTISQKKQDKFGKSNWSNGATTLNDAVTNFTSNRSADEQLLPHTLASLKAQFKMHIKRSILDENIGKQLIDAVEIIAREQELNKSLPLAANIYDAIEKRVSELAPTAAEWFNVARSQSAQKSGDLNMYIRNAIDSLDAAIKTTQESIVRKAEETVKTLYPSNLVNQVAQPTSLGHHLLAIVEAFARDRARLKDCRSRVNISPYASGSIAGNSFNVNREMVSRLLDFEKSSANSVDAICSRDNAIEFLSAVATAFQNLSRVCSEIIQWRSTQNNFIEFEGGMHKSHENLPYYSDVPALQQIKIRASIAIGNLTSAYTLIKDLPLEPNLEYDGLPQLVIKSYTDLLESQRQLASLFENMTIKRKNMKEAASTNFSTSQDLVDWIIQKNGISMHEAAKRAQAIIDYAIEKGKKLSLLELEELQQFEPAADADIYSVLIPSRAIISRRSGNGSNPVQIRKHIRAVKRKYL